MTDADVRQALYAAFYELERGVVNLILDENPDLGAATAQLKQLQPKHRPIVLPAALVKKPKAKNPAAVSQQPHGPRQPVLPVHNPSLPSRGWWPVAEGVALGEELSEKERATLAFVCEMFPSVELGTASAVLKESGGEVEAAVALLSALDAVNPPASSAMQLADHGKLPDIASADLRKESDEEDEEQAEVEAEEVRTTEAFPALKRVPKAAPMTRKARKALGRLEELFPLLSASTLHAALDKHAGDAAAAADELLLGDEQGVMEEDEGKKKAGDKRLTWHEVAKLVKCPPPRPWGQLLKPTQQLPPLVYTPPAAAGGAAAAPPLSLDKSDLSRQLKWRMLRARVPWVEEEVLESVWVFSNYSLLHTLHALATLYPEPFSYNLLPPLKASPSASSVSSVTPSVSSSSSPSIPASPSPIPMRTVAVSAPPSLHAPSAQAAKDLAARRHLLCHAAAQAFVAGNGARAKQLAAEAREASESLRGAHEARWRAAHTQASRRGAPLLEVDLHGLTVDDALDVVTRVVAHMRQALLEDPNRPRLLSLITGVGKHSAGGVARIRPALIAHLKREGVPYNEARTGHIVVRVSSV